MAISKARDIATSIGKAVKADRITSAGLIPSSAAAFSVYDSTVSLPTSDIAVGSQAYISSNQRLYIRGTGGWYNIATVNNTPSINSVQTAAGDSSPFSLATDGSTTTVITINATDSEGFPITFSATTDVGFDSIATVSNDSSVFTITPLSEDSAGTATSGTLTFKASDGVNIASEVATFTLVFKITNSNFTNTLLKASGNNGTNVTMSGMTVGGDASTQAFSPYHPGGYSVYFDGNDDRLEVASIPDLSGGPYTIEGWYYFDSDPNSSTYLLWSLNTGSNNGYAQLQTVSGNNYLRLQQRGGQHLTNGDTFDMFKNTWYHIATVWDGTNMKVYVNGYVVLSSTTNVVQNAGNGLTINGDGGGSFEFAGYISDFRIVNGTAVYTANFTPPTVGLTAISGTSLLACHLPYIGDGSTNNYSITLNGNTHTRRFGPYEYSSYNASSHGSSVYFDGTGDKLTASYDAGYSFGTGDFTIEAWIYPTALSSNRLIIDTYASGENGSYQLYWRATGTSLAFYTVGDGVYLQDSSSGNIILNSWNHVAVSRSGTTARLFVNGKIVDTATNSRDMTHDNTLCIGAQNSTSTNYFNGFISDVRIVKGTAVYTAAFTPTNTPLSSISGTSILTCNDAPNVFDATGQARVKTDGAKSSTSSTKYASASIQTGTSDRVYFYPITSASEFDDLTGDYTIEAWVKLDSSTLDYANIVLYRDESNTSNPHILLRFGNSGFGYHLQFRVTGTGSSNVHSVNLTQTNFSNYRHVALVRNDGNIKLYVDGVHYPTNTGADPSSFPNSQVVNSDSISAADKFEVGGAFDGNIEDFRFTKNLARYPFIPPRTTLTSSDQANTKLIACHASTATTDGAGLQTITANGTPLVNQAGPHAGMLSVYFDGSDEALRTSDNSSLSMGTGDFTIEAWIKPDNTSSAYRAILSDNLYGDSGSWCIYQYGTKLYVASDNNAISTLGGSGNTVLSAGTWSHIAFTRASGTARLFHNRVQVGSDTSLTTNFTDDQIVIGANNHNSNYPAFDFIGYISNVRVIKGTAIYNKSFTPPTLELTG